MRNPSSRNDHDGYRYALGAFDLRQAKPIYYSATSFKSRMDLIRAAMEGVTLEVDEDQFINAAIKVAVSYNSFRRGPQAEAATMFAGGNVG